MLLKCYSFSLITQALTSALSHVVLRASWQVEKKEKEKKSYTMPHLTGLCLKPLNHGEYQINHQQCQQVSTESKSTCPNQISGQELNTLIQLVHRRTMRTPLPRNSFLTDLNSVWFRQMFNKCSVALEISLSNTASLIQGKKKDILKSYW